MKCTDCDSKLIVISTSYGQLIYCPECCVDGIDKMFMTRRKIDDKNHKRCKQHGYSYMRYCWFCLCEFHNLPEGFAIGSSGYNHGMLEVFLKKHPNGRLN